VGVLSLYRALPGPLSAGEPEAAVAALAELLQQCRGALAATGSGAPEAKGETEELREQLLSYRNFCERLGDLAQQLPEPAEIAR
jgi:hypothetical protein